MTRPTLEELRALLPAKDGKRRGLYAGPPGSGPEGKTCHHCMYLTFTGNVRRHPKCGKTKYTHGDATTILTRSAACHHFRQHDPELEARELAEVRAGVMQKPLARPTAMPLSPLRTHRGDVTKWLDTRDYGFIAPDDGGNDVFVHRTALQPRSCAIGEGDRVEFEVEEASPGKRQRATSCRKLTPG